MRFVKAYSLLACVFAITGCHGAASGSRAESGEYTFLHAENGILYVQPITKGLPASERTFHLDPHAVVMLGGKAIPPEKIPGFIPITVTRSVETHRVIKIVAR